MQTLACAFTGHRPNRFHFGDDENHADCLKIKSTMREWVEIFIARGVSTFYFGAAIGVDLWAASIVLDLKKSHPNISLNAVVPCKTQPNSWTIEQQKRYRDILSQCDHVNILHERYTRGCMFERNRSMIDQSDYLLAVYDGGEDGGTAYTVKYSKKKHRKIIIIHPDTLEVTKTFD